MLKLIQNFASKYREVLAYLFFGVLTTMVNYAVYLSWVYAFPGEAANVSGVAVSWIVSVLFAYFTNRKWVFKSSAAGFLPNLRECGAFFSGRVFTGLLDLGTMYLTVDVLGFDGGLMKLFSNVFVVILNYILSKLIIFKKQS